MIPTRLICIDGIPGSGKSTTSQRLCLQLLANGFTARWFYEHGPDSPIWGNRERYRLTESDITDPSVIQDLVIARWRAFINGLLQTDTTALIESSFLHSTVAIMLGMDFDPEAILESVARVEEVVAAASPVSIHLYASDVRRALRAICDERRYDQFEAPMVELVSRTRYAKARALSGFDGAVEFFQRCREITDRAFARLTMRKLAIEYSERNWAVYEQQITDFLSLPGMASMDDPIEGASRFVGTFKDPNSAAEFVAAADEKGLYLDDERHTRLMHQSGNTFWVNGIWLQVCFEEEQPDGFQQIRVSGNVPDLSPVWMRVKPVASQHEKYMGLPSDTSARINVLILCGGMGKRMFEATGGQMSKGRLPIVLRGNGHCPETQETVLGMLVRTSTSSPLVQQIMFLTSDKWLAEHTELATELAGKYKVNVLCRTDNSTGEEFPPSAFAALVQQIGENVESHAHTLIINGDILFSPAAFQKLLEQISDRGPLIAIGETEEVPYLGMTFVSAALAWHSLIEEIAAANIYQLMEGLWKRVSVLSVNVEGPIYDCGSMTGYRKAYDDAREGKLW